MTSSWRARIAAVLAVVFLVPGAHAQEIERERPSIERAELVARLAHGDWVEGATVEAEHLIFVLAETTHPVRLRDCTVKGDLDLDRLPVTSLAEAEPPAALAGDRAAVKRWRARSGAAWMHYVGEPVPLRRVVQPISIVRSTIDAWIQGHVVVFEGKVDFSGSQFEQDVDLDGSTFAYVPEGPAATRAPRRARPLGADFRSARFAREANFRGASFLGRSSFSRTNFERAIFEGAGFQALVSFERARFGSASFGRLQDSVETVFRGPANFREADWSSAARFTHSRFRDIGEFGGSRFGANTFFRSVEGRFDFTEARFDKKVFFSEAKLHKSVFSDAKFFDLALFSRGEFTGTTSFDDAVFEGGAGFREARFDKTLFASARFEGRVSFSEAVFLMDAKFDGVVFPDRVEFSGVLFRHDTAFWRATFGEADFSQAKFCQVDFDGSRFRRRADFRGAIFHTDATFPGVAFDGPVAFREATIAGALVLDHAVLPPYLDLRGTRIGLLNLHDPETPRVVQGRLDLRDAALLRAHFEDLVFSQPAEFSGAHFGAAGPVLAEPPAETTCAFEVLPRQLLQQPQTDETSGLPQRGVAFRDVTFERRATFLGTRFEGRTTIAQTRFLAEADLTDARFEPGGATAPWFTFSHVRFRNLRVSMEELPPASAWTAGAGQEMPSEALRRLEKAFRDQQRLDDANRAHFESERAELREARAGTRPPRERLVAEFEWLTWGLTTGYGTRFSWILAWCLGVTGLFALLYAVFGRLERWVAPPVDTDHTFRLRLFDFPREYSDRAPDHTPRAEAEAEGTDNKAAARTERIRPTASWEKLRDATRLSAVLVFKVGRRDTIVSGTVGPINLHWFLVLEWLLGYLLLAGLVITLANTQPLLNRLLSGLF